MFVYWSNEAKNPFFEANNFKLWVRSHSLFMPRNDFARIIEKYKTKDNTIDPQKIADYFNIGYGDVINRGRVLGFFNI